jgi:hypothetical protein
MGLYSSNCPTHKTKTKRTIKIKNPKNNIEKAKRKGEKKTGKKKINKNFKNYRKKEKHKKKVK